LPTAQMEPYKQLHEHGFTVLTPPSNWRYQYPPQKWHGEVVVEAVNRAANLPLEQRSNRPSGYDGELARAVMESLNETYPASITLIELKYQFSEEPSDENLSTALSALRGDGYIDGARAHGNSKLNPLERISLTAEGRRHLADEMKKRSKSPQEVSDNDASRSILSQLLSEFRERQLTASDLRSSYKGLPPSELRYRSIANGISEVDFDLAISDLTSNGLVDTGPKELVKNAPYSGVVFLDFFTSKNEYSYLTEDGYREAVRLTSRDRETRTSANSAAQRAIIHGDQYINYGQAGAIGPHSAGTLNYQQQWGAIQNQVDLSALAVELEQLKKHVKQTASSTEDFRQLAILSEAEESAKRQNGGKVLEVLSKAGKGLLDVAKEISKDLAAKMIAKSLGMEP